MLQNCHKDELDKAEVAPTQYWFIFFHLLTSNLASRILFKMTEESFEDALHGMFPVNLKEYRANQALKGKATEFQKILMNYIKEKKGTFSPQKRRKKNDDQTSVRPFWTASFSNWL